MSILSFKSPVDNLCLAQSECIGDAQDPFRSFCVTRGCANETDLWPPPYPHHIPGTPSRGFCTGPLLEHYEAMCKGNQNRCPLQEYTRHSMWHGVHPNPARSSPFSKSDQSRQVVG